MSRGPSALEDATHRWRVPWVEVSAPDGLHVNLDGEPVNATEYRFEIDRRQILLALPEDTPLVR